MNREIKFRGFDKEVGMMFPLDESINLEELRKGVISHDGENWIECIYMQFTGLHDKNGKEIYEGDIVKLSLDKIGKNYHLFQVIYNEPECRYKLRFVDSTDNLIEERFYDFNISKIYEFNGEIIGNIYENGDLLK